MRTTVEITQQARHDLEKIASYIPQDNPIAADRLDKQLLNAAHRKPGKRSSKRAWNCTQPLLGGDNKIPSIFFSQIAWLDDDGSLRGSIRKFSKPGQR